MKTRCIIRGCSTMGEPHEGFDFFVCEPHLDALATEMERLIGKDATDLCAEALAKAEVTA